MKLLIMVALLTLIASTSISMFLTGTFKQSNAEDDESIEAEEITTEETATEEAIPEEIPTEETTTEDAQVEDAVPQTQTEQQDHAESEIKLRATLEKYKAQIAEAEADLAAIKAEIESLNSVKTSINRSQQLAKIYSSMKPDSAAAILCQLNEAFTEQILSEMSTNAVGKIMDAIASADPDYCVKLSKLMGGKV